MKEEREYIIKEIEELAPRLAGIERSNAFRVPDGYFSQLESLVLDRINDLKLQEGVSIDHPVKKDESMEVPDGYFSSLQDSILKRIAQEETKTLPVKLQSLKHVNPFKVPQGYFERLSEQVLSQVEEQPKANDTGPIFRLFNPKLGLIAAALTGIVLTVFLLQVPRDTDKIVDINQEDLIEYLVEHIDEFAEDELIPLVNDEQLGDFNMMDVLDDDIQQYLTDEEIDLDINEIL